MVWKKSFWTGYFAVLSCVLFCLPGYGNAATLSISTTKLPTVVAGSSYAQTIAATGGTTPYTYSISSGSLPKWAKLASATGKITGTPTDSQIGSTTFTVKVTDAKKSTATQVLVLTAYAYSGGHNSYLNGHYAFLASGYVDGINDGGTYKAAVAGSFVADGKGNLSSGIVDYVDATGSTGTGTAITGTYALSSANIGELTLVLGSGQAITLAMTAGSVVTSPTAVLATAGSLIEFDDKIGIGNSRTFGGRRLTGEFARQTTTDFATAKLSGGYAFGVDGETCPINDIPSSLISTYCKAAKDKGTLSIAGVLNFSGKGTLVAGKLNAATGVSSGSEEQVTVGGEGANVKAGNYEVALSGSYGAPSGTGRATLSLSTGTPLPSSDQAIWPTHFVVYMVNASKFYLLSVDDHLRYALMAGRAIKQTVSNFTAANLSGNAIVWGVQPNGSYTYEWGTSAANSSANDSIARIVANASKATFSFTQLQSNAGKVSSGSTTGSYKVASNGRVTATVTGTTEVAVFYLSATNTGFSTQVGGSHAGLMTLEPQSATTLSAGNYVITGYAAAPRTDLVTGLLDVQQVSGSTGNTGTVTLDQSDPDGTLKLDKSNSGTVTVSSTGLITLKGEGAWGYVISPTRLATINPSTSNTNPDIETLQQ